MSAFTPNSGHLDSSSRGGSQRNMQREIGASWNRQSRQVATQLLRKRIDQARAQPLARGWVKTRRKTNAFVAD